MVFTEQASSRFNRLTVEFQVLIFIFQADVHDRMLTLERLRMTFALKSWERLVLRRIRLQAKHFIAAWLTYSQNVCLLILRRPALLIPLAHSSCRHPFHILIVSDSQRR